ncbi:MAG: hypothetical protein AAGJ86_00125 [Pseudomonadota bacterium]
MFPSNPFSMVVAIVFIGCIYSIVTHYIDSRAKSREAGADSAGNDEVIRIIESLEHRIVVLERIVTDSGYSLKREIDNL